MNESLRKTADNRVALNLERKTIEVKVIIHSREELETLVTSLYMMAEVYWPEETEDGQ